MAGIDLKRNLTPRATPDAARKAQEEEDRRNENSASELGQGVEALYRTFPSLRPTDPTTDVAALSHLTQNPVEEPLDLYDAKDFDPQTGQPREGSAPSFSYNGNKELETAKKLLAYRTSKHYADSYLKPEREGSTDVSFMNSLLGGLGAAASQAGTLGGVAPKNFVTPTFQGFNEAAAGAHAERRDDEQNGVKDLLARYKIGEEGMTRKEVANAQLLKAALAGKKGDTLSISKAIPIVQKEKDAARLGGGTAGHLVAQQAGTALAAENQAEGRKQATRDDIEKFKQKREGSQIFKDTGFARNAIDRAREAISIGGPGDLGVIQQLAHIWDKNSIVTRGEGQEILKFSGNLPAQFKALMGMWAQGEGRLDPETQQKMLQMIDQSWQRQSTVQKQADAAALKEANITATPAILSDPYNVYNEPVSNPAFRHINPLPGAPTAVPVGQRPPSQAVPKAKYLPVIGPDGKSTGKYKRAPAGGG